VASGGNLGGTALSVTRSNPCSIATSVSIQSECVGFIRATDLNGLHSKPCHPDLYPLITFQTKGVDFYTFSVYMIK